MHGFFVLFEIFALLCRQNMVGLHRVIAFIYRIYHSSLSNQVGKIEDEQPTNQF